MLGTTIGKYEIISEIGRGGMGIVYKGIQKSLNRDVAIKVLPPHLANESDSVERFIQEANLIAKLNHHNIVRIYDIEEKDSSYFIIMEYLDGVSLDKIIHGEEWTVSREEMVEFVVQVCYALQSTHQHGIIHRDVKSANIFITREKNVKLMDFGISKMTSSTMTTGKALGTPSYMSPEQVKGEPLDAQSDIYSLGVVLYECLTARLPFTGEDAFSIALKHVNENPSDPIKLDSSIPYLFNRCCMTALSKNKALRFKTCEDMALALQGNWPVYLSQSRAFKERSVAFVKDIFEDRMFLPGNTAIAVLISLMVFQQMAIKYPEDVMPNDFLKPAKMTVKSRHIPVPVDSVKEEAGPVVLEEDPKIKAGDLERIDLAIEGNQLFKAEEIINELVKVYGDNEEITVRGERLRIKKERISLLKEIEHLAQIKEYKKALKKMNYLCALHPGDILLEQQKKYLQDEWEQYQKRVKFLEQLKALKQKGEWEKLLERVKDYLRFYPEDEEGKNFLFIAKKEIELEQKKAIIAAAMNKARFFMDEKKPEKALSLVREILLTENDHIPLLQLEKEILETLNQKKVFQFQKQEEKDLLARLNDFSRAFSEKNTDLFRELISHEDPGFYDKEVSSFSDLVALTGEIYSSFSIANCTVEENSANLSMYWKLSVLFSENKEVVALIDDQVRIGMKKEKGIWKIKGFTWI